MKYLYRIIAFLVLSSLLSSCIQHRQLLYFRNQSEFVPLQDHDITNQVRIRIQPDDILTIQVSSPDQTAAIPFNLQNSRGGGGGSSGGGGSGQAGGVQGYLVDPNGNIDFPVLGRMQVQGMTTQNLKDTLITQLKVYLKDPVVNIRFNNFRVYVFGETGSSSTIQVQGERITIIELMIQAGEITPYSNRQKITLIREKDGKREFGYLDISQPDIFQSPYFYLQQNDIIYVEPLKSARVNVRDPIRDDIALVSSVISFGLFIIALISR